MGIVSGTLLISSVGIGIDKKHLKRVDIDIGKYFDVGTSRINDYKGKMIASQLSSLGYSTENSSLFKMK